jgi:hypothetical protein
MLEKNVSTTSKEAMGKKQEDIQFGDATEQEVLPLLDKFFGEKHYKAMLPSGEVDTYCRWDFINEARTARRELKGRRVRHDQYPTALLNYSKIRNQDPSIQYTYIWKYTDGIYYLPYDKKVWDTFDVREMAVWRDGQCERQLCINVPHHRLRLLTP